MYFTKLKFKTSFVLFEIERNITKFERRLAKFKEDNELIENEITKLKLFKSFIIESQQEYIQLDFETYCKLVD